MGDARTIDLLDAAAGLVQHILDLQPALAAECPASGVVGIDIDLEVMRSDLDAFRPAGRTFRQVPAHLPKRAVEFLPEQFRGPGPSRRAIVHRGKVDVGIETAIVRPLECVAAGVLDAGDRAAQFGMLGIDVFQRPLCGSDLQVVARRIGGGLGLRSEIFGILGQRLDRLAVGWRCGIEPRMGIHQSGIEPRPGFTEGFVDRTDLPRRMTRRQLGGGTLLDFALHGPHAGTPDAGAGSGRRLRRPRPEPHLGLVGLGDPLGHGRNPGRHLLPLHHRLAEEIALQSRLQALNRRFRCACPARQRGLGSAVRRQPSRRCAAREQDIGRQRTGLERGIHQRVAIGIGDLEAGATEVDGGLSKAP